MVSLEASIEILRIIESTCGCWRSFSWTGDFKPWGLKRVKNKPFGDLGNKFVDPAETVSETPYGFWEPADDGEESASSSENLINGWKGFLNGAGVKVHPFPHARLWNWGRERFATEYLGSMIFNQLNPTECLYTDTAILLADGADAFVRWPSKAVVKQSAALEGHRTECPATKGLTLPVEYVVPCDSVSQTTKRRAVEC